MAPTEAILERGREHYARQEWGAAHDALASAGAALDIERRATCSYMLGREDEYLALLADAHRAHLDEGDASSAVRCGFWIGAQHAQNGDIAQAGGWLGRARRIYEQHGGEEVALGYLMLPEVFERMGSGDLAGAAAVAGEAAAIAERGGDRELFALSAHMQGHMLIAAGRAAEGLPLLDEAMLPAASGELSPIATGIVYCGVILACRDAYEVRRAREWTAVLSDWCERQPDLVAFTGRCRIHRAEILQLGGSWAEALDEAREARERALRGGNEDAAGEACFRQGELHRLRGEWAAAERAYREANRNGREPQPGLALLRLAQGDVEAALGLVRRTLAETEAPGARVALLPAAIEILVAAGELEEASGAAEELGGLIDADECPALAAALLHARAGIAVAGDDPASALPLVRRAAGSGRSSAPPTSSRRRASWRDSRAGRPGTRRAPRSSSTPRAGPTPSCGPAPTSSGSTGRRAAGRTTASRPVSSRCCAWWRPARPTGRSPTASCSACAPSTGTSATST